MSANILSWSELECLIQQRYPGISRDDAYVRLFHDLKPLMKPLMDPTAKGSFSILKALGIIFNKPVTSLVASASRIAQRILEAISQNPTCTSQPVEDNPNDISDQIIIQMLRNLAATAGEPTNVAAGTGFSLCGENMIEHRIGGYVVGSSPYKMSKNNRPLTKQEAASLAVQPKRSKSSVIPSTLGLNLLPSLLRVLW